MLDRIKLFLFKNTSSKQTVVKNTFWLFISETTGRLLKMALVIYAARVLGAEGWGTFSYVLSLGSLLMIFSDVGLGSLITREAVQKKEGYSSFISAIFLLKGGLLLLSTALVIVVGPKISHISGTGPLFFVIAIILFFDSLRDLVLAINMVSEKMERDMLVKTIMNVIILTLGISLLKIQLSPESIAIAYAVGSTTGFIMAAFLIKKDIAIFFSKTNTTTIQHVFKTVLPFAIISLIMTILTNTDIYMLGIWKNASEIGFYASAQRIQQFTLIIPVMIAAAFFPAFSRLANTDNEKFKSILEKTTALLLAVGIPIALGGAILATPLTILFFGTNYIAAIPVVRILILSIILSYPLVLLSNAIIAYNKQRYLAMAYLSGVLVNILLNTLLIPPLGAAGAAIATMASSAVITLIVWRKVNTIIKFQVVHTLKNVVFATLVIIIFIILSMHSGIHIILIIVISIVLYTSTLYFLKEPLLKELRMSI